MAEALTIIPMGFFVLLALVIGLAVGSFLNVVIHRLPRGESIVFPASHCPACAAPIKPWHNIPVFSYILLRGRCSACGAPFSPRYPLVELLGGLVAVIGVLRFGITVDLLGCLLLGWFGIALAFIDLETKTVPDHLVLPLGLGGVLVALLRGGWMELVTVGISALVAVLFFLLVYGVARLMRGREAMGTGDITLATALSLYLYPLMLPFALLLAVSLSLIGALLWAFVARRPLREQELPFAPGLVLGGFLLYAAGNGGVEWAIGSLIRILPL